MKPVSVFRILAAQFQSVVVLLLVAAVALALASGDLADAVAIGAVLLINTTLGFGTELRARRAMEALLGLEVPRAWVLREGHVREVDSRELVPGDILQVDAGQAVPADARLLTGAELLVNEASLTGESVPAAKDPTRHLSPATPLPGRSTMLYQATSVVAGSGRAVVVATGMDTEVGRIGALTSRVRPARTPLERRLDQLGRRLVWIALGAAAVVAVLGALRGEPGQAVQVGLALAVAAVPEGLPVVATIALAVAVHRMARRRALVRRLPAVETLGSATLICTDKTGTLTAGEMTVTDLWVGGVSFEVTGSGYAPDGDFLHHGQLVASGQREALDLALRVGALANRAGVDRTDQGWTARGDPTEAALLVLARKAGLERDRLLQTWPEVAEVPFSSSRRWMATLHRGPDGDLQACVKGAPERVLEVSGRLLTPDGPVGLDEVRRREVLKHNQALASRGLRVLALAFGPVQRPAIESVKELTFIGLVGMIDPPAPGVADTIRRLREAGVRTIMLTGDQRPTAEAVGRTLGLLSGEDRTFDGAEVARLEGSALAQILERAGAFSRLGPEEKLKLVDAYQRRGEIVAMLGDGVNDAAALKKADIGVVMGARGSDVAREVATVVLQDDRFATVAAAVEEGRVAFDNIRKFIFYLFSCNLAEVMLVLGAGVMGLPLPVLPLQILWLNLITDTFPALALAVEPGDPEVMKQPPRDPRAAILSRRMLAVIASYAALITFSAMAAFVWMLRSPTGTAGRATSAAFATLGLAQSFHLGNARSAAPVTSRRLALRNRYALAAVGVAVAAQVAAVHVSPLARALHVSPLLPADWLVVFLLAALPALAGQVFKHVRQARLTPES